MAHRLRSLEGRVALLSGTIRPLRARPTTSPRLRATAKQRWEAAIELCRLEGCADPLREAGHRFETLRLLMLAEVNGLPAA